MMMSSGWGQMPGIVVVAPQFTFFDAADSAKVLEEELGMFTIGYLPHSEAGRRSALAFAAASIPIVRFWI